MRRADRHRGAEEWVCHWVLAEDRGAEESACHLAYEAVMRVWHRHRHREREVPLGLVRKRRELLRAELEQPGLARAELEQPGLARPGQESAGASVWSTPRVKGSRALERPGRALA